MNLNGSFNSRDAFRVRNLYPVENTFPAEQQKLFLGNAKLNTMVIRKTISGTSFSYTSADYYETQVIRLGYTYKF